MPDSGLKDRHFSEWGIEREKKGQIGGQCPILVRKTAIPQNGALNTEYSARLEVNAQFWSERL